MKKKPELFFSIFPFIIFLFVLSGISHAEPLEKIVSGLQTYLSNTNDFTSSFTQITQLQSFDEKQKANGKVYFKKPGKMRWEYHKPEIQTIVINSKQVWLYTPEENQVIKTSVEQVDTSAIYDLFLYDKTNIREVFNISIADDNQTVSKNALLLNLNPKNKEINIKKIILELKKPNYQIKSFISYDKLDNVTTIKFTDMVINKGLKDSIFNFKPPNGVELITSEDLGA